jgi:hypothetical protein
MRVKVLFDNPASPISIKYNQGKATLPKPYECYEYKV